MHGCSYYASVFCPVCEYESDASERCPECGHEFAAFDPRIDDRLRFARNIVICRFVWIGTGVLLPLYLLFVSDGGHAAMLVGILYVLFAWVATLAVIPIERHLVMKELYRLEARKGARTAWCILVGGSGPLLCILWILARAAGVL